MDRHRCTTCRNPIRGEGIVGPGPGPDEPESWFHPDCWEQARTSVQEDYEEQVRSAGIDALIAPYVNRAFASVAPAGEGPAGIAV